MNLETFLKHNQTIIQKKWFKRIAEQYPSDSANFLEREKDRFANPVGYTIGEATGVLLEGLLQGCDIESLAESLEGIVKIKAVQEFTPQQALDFVFFLKRIVREEIAGEPADVEWYRDLLEFESRIDRLALLGFDLFMKNREKIYELKSSHIKHLSYKLLERANLLTGDSEGGCRADIEPETPCKNGGRAK